MRIILKISDIINGIRCWLHPHNVITISRLPKTWVDRDKLMFHAMFQILVDFIELEQPFAPASFKGKRFTSKKAMVAEIKKMSSPEFIRSRIHGDVSADVRARIVGEVLNSVDVYTEMFKLYEWYKNKEYEYEYRLDLDLESRIADQERHEVQCSKMLERVLAIRKHLWT